MVTYGFASYMMPIWDRCWDITITGTDTKRIILCRVKKTQNSNYNNKSFYPFDKNQYYDDVKIISFSPPYDRYK